MKSMLTAASNNGLSDRARRMPKTLLLTSSRPGVGSVGELFLGALCKLYSPGQLICFAAVSPAYEVPVPDSALSWLPTIVKNLPGEYAWQYTENRLSTIIRRFRHFELLESSLIPFVDSACDLIAQNDIELLWLVLNSPSAVLIAEKVLEKTGLPAIGIVWDPISSITEQARMDKRSRMLLESRAAAVVKRLRSCGVASPGMKEFFAEVRQDLPTRVLINTPTASAVRDLQERDRVVITFSGSLYAQDELQGLIAALNAMKWKLDDKPIELKIFSAAFNIPIHAGGGATNLTFGGYLSEEALFEELKNSDVAYLPYWFAKEYSEAVKRCFPAKLAMYVAAGCPVLYHGPKDSSPARFLAKYAVGKGVHGFDPVKFSDALRYLTRDQEFRHGYLHQRNLALAEEIGHELFEQRFLELIELAIEGNPGNK